MTPLKLNLILFLSAFAALSGHTQSGGEQQTLRINFSVFPLESSNWEGILYAPNGDPNQGTEELHFNPHQRTVGFSYNGPTSLRFYREVVLEEGLKGFEVVAEVSLGNRGIKGDLILFFSPVKKDQNDGPYEVSYMFDSPSSFPDDSLVFFNSMNVTFEGILGKKRITLAPGASKPIDVSDYFDEPTPIMLVLEHNDDVHRVLKNKIRFTSDRRTLYILRKPNSPNSLRIRTQRLTEYTGPRGSSDEPGA